MLLSDFHCKENERQHLKENITEMCGLVSYSETKTAWVEKNISNSVISVTWRNLFCRKLRNVENE